MIPKATIEPTDNQDNTPFSKDSAPSRESQKPQTKTNTQLQSLQLHSFL
jgi:hypothetical protein